MVTLDDSLLMDMKDEPKKKVTFDEEEYEEIEDWLAGRSSGSEGWELETGAAELMAEAVENAELLWELA